MISDQDIAPSSKIETYRDLIAWQKAMDLVEVVYEATDGFPKAEVYGLVSQMRRSAVSIPSNLAEGFGRNSDGSFLQFCRISQGSLRELETQIILSGRLGYMDPKVVNELLGRANEIGKILYGLMRSIERRKS